MSYIRLTTKKYGTYLASCENCSYNNPSFDCDAHSCKQVLIKRLGELEDKIENGTLIEFPCKVGDTVYWANVYRPTPKVEEYKVYGFRINDKIAVLVDFNSYLYLEEISFTKAEAEKKLEKRKGGVK